MTWKEHELIYCKEISKKEFDYGPFEYWASAENCKEYLEIASESGGWISFKWEGKYWVGQRD